MPKPAVAFNEAINHRDLQGLRELMTDDRMFIESDGNLIRGKEEVLQLAGQGLRVACL